MLDGAEQILIDEGYGALTSRRVAEVVGVKQRLVYYYFETMDDLIVETFRRLAERELQRLQEALTHEKPLRKLWQVCAQTTDTRLVSEFMALANRNEVLREEVKNYIRETRRIQVEAIKTSQALSGRESTIAPAAAAIFATSAALAIHREKALGIRMGHGEVLAAIESFLEGAE